MVGAFASLHTLRVKTVAENGIIAPLLGQTNLYGLTKAGAKIKADPTTGAIANKTMAVV